jgi:hypothetical protein
VQVRQTAYKEEIFAHEHCRRQGNLLCTDAADVRSASILTGTKSQTATSPNRSLRSRRLLRHVLLTQTGS